MNSNAPLTGSHLRTYQTIFRHPVSHNLGWHDVHALFRHLGSMEEEPNGNFRVTRNGQSMVLHPSRTKDVAETDELMGLRRFLERSEPAAPAANETSAQEAHWLVVINHREARIYRSAMRDAVPQRILPHGPEDYFRHEPSSKDFSRGPEKPEPNSFFGPVIKALQSGGPVLILGSGTGRGSEMEQFLAWAKLRHPEFASRIVGSLVIDEHHLTEGQLLAKAREFYVNIRTD